MKSVRTAEEAGNFRLLVERNLRGPPAMTEYRRDAGPDNGPGWKSKGGRDGRCIWLRPVARCIISRGGRGERQWGNVRAIRGARTKKEEKMRRVYAAKLCWQRAGELSAFARARNSSIQERRTGLPWRGPSTRAASGMQRGGLYVARRKRTGQKNEKKKRRKSNKTNKRITGNGVQRWSSSGIA